MGCPRLRKVTRIRNGIRRAAPRKMASGGIARSGRVSSWARQYTTSSPAESSRGCSVLVASGLANESQDKRGERFPVIAATGLRGARVVSRMGGWAIFTCSLFSHERCGVGTSWSGLWDFDALDSLFRGIRARNRRLGSWAFTKAWFGLPADFLVSGGGIVKAVHYGRHAGDQWSVDEVLGFRRFVGRLAQSQNHYQVSG
jgi:hypothetical protein